MSDAQIARVRRGRKVLLDSAACISVCLWIPGAVGVAGAQACVGDCNGDGRVAVAELIDGVRIGLQILPLKECMAFDGDRDGEVHVFELVAGVGGAMCSCGNLCPTATPTPSRSPSATPSPTGTDTRRSSPTATPTSTRTPFASPTSTPPEVGEVLFAERFERSNPRRIVPNSLFSADSGDWFLGDTVSAFPEKCGKSPHFGEVIEEEGSRRLRLHSGVSGSECADNVYAGPVRGLGDLARGAPGIPVSPDLFISFREVGQLNSLDECQGVFVTVVIDEVAPFTYVLERGRAWDARGFGCGGGISQPRPLLLPPGGPLYVRNVLSDAIEAGLDVAGRVTGLSLQVDSDGEATFDDIILYRAP